MFLRYMNVVKYTLCDTPSLYIRWSPLYLWAFVFSFTVSVIPRFVFPSFVFK